jgi:hypothetical protein
MIEASIAGLAAGLVAGGQADTAVYRAPRIDVIYPDVSQADDEASIGDMALVDAAICAERFIASRAVWDMSKIKEVVLTRAEPGNIGLSAIGSHLLGGGCPPGYGLYLRLDPTSSGKQVLAPIAPGLVRPVRVAEYQLLAPNDELIISHDYPCVLALDGERELELRPGSSLRLRFNLNGPHVINARKAIELASQAGYFIQETL